MLRGHPKSGEFWPAILLHRVQPAVWLGVALASFVRRRGGNGALTRGDLNAEHGLRARISRGWRAGMRPIASAGAVKAIAAGDRAAPPFGLRRPPPRPRAGPGYPTDRGRGQLRRETEGRPGRRPRAALRLTCGTIIRPRGLRDSQDRAARQCLRRRRPKNCDARADDQRAARWLDEWRYVWSCDGPDECGVRTAGQSEPVADGLGVQIWARKRVRCQEAVIAFRGTVGGDKGDWASNFHWILRAFPIYDRYDQVRDHVGDFIGHIERDNCYREGVTEVVAVGHSLGAGWPSSRPIPITASAGFTPSIRRW